MAKKESMNKTELKAYNWLLKQGYREEDIDFNPHRSIDFVVKGEGFYEAKRLFKGVLMLTDKQQRTFEKYNPTVLLFDDNAEEPITVSPFSEIKHKVKLYNPKNSGRYCRVGILFERETLEKLEDLCREKGLSLSSLVRMAIKEWLKGEKHE